MGYELEDVLGNVIAQHPSYNRYLEVNKKEDKIELRLIIKKQKRGHDRLTRGQI